MKDYIYIPYTRCFGFGIVQLSVNKEGLQLD